jgi:glutamine synthetase
MASANLELKPSDSSANPYLALGGLIAAGLDGVTNDMIPSQDLELNAAPSSLSNEELSARGIQKLPQTLDEAVQALEDDPVLMDSLGSTLSEAYVAIRRANAILFSEHDEQYEIRHHFHKY